MSRSIYYGWFFVILLVFFSSIFQFFRRGFSLRVVLGLVIGTAALLFLRMYKNKIK